MRYVDQKKWKRKKHFEFFRKFKNPHFNICTEIEITNTYLYTRKNRSSIFTAVLYAVMKACNELEEFKYRIRRKKVLVHDTVHPGITVLTEGDIYSNCIFKFYEPYGKFLNEYKQALMKAKRSINIGEEQKGRDDLIFISALPWISFTSASNPMDGNPTDSIPRIIWGKHFKKGKKIMIPMSVQVHHALMDGVHVSKFFIKISEILKEPEKLFSVALRDQKR